MQTHNIRKQEVSLLAQEHELRLAKSLVMDVDLGKQEWLSCHCFSALKSALLAVEGAWR